MIYRTDVSPYFVVINNVKIPVPRGVWYVTINMYGVVEGWSEHPYISEGCWNCNTSDSIRIGEVDFEDGDSGHYHVYEVQCS
jgi:hypothetical protein